MSDDFLYRTIPVLGKRVHRYGLSCILWPGRARMREGLERGANYIFWSPAKKFLRTIIKDVVAPNRERYVLATGPILGYFAGSVRRATEKALRASGSDYLDICRFLGQPHVAAFEIRAGRDGETARRGQSSRRRDL